MAECVSNASSQSLENKIIEDDAGDQNQTGTSVNINISASGGNWTQMKPKEEIPQPETVKLEEDDTNEINELLSMTVAKDYINCVWTCEPDGDGKNVATDKISATADPTLNNCESYDPSKSLCPEQMAEEKPSLVRSPVIIRRKRKYNSKKKSKLVADAANEVVTTLNSAENSNSPVQADENEQSDPSKSLCPEQMAKGKPSLVRSPVIIRRKRKYNSKKKSKLVADAANEVVTTLNSAENSNSPVQADENEQSQAKQRTKKKANKTLIEKIDIVSPISQECPDKNPTLFSAYKQFVVNRPVPLYNPSLLNSPFPTENLFDCKACGDKFMLETSLKGHMNRRVGRLSYRCPVCEDRLCFDNRCAFLNHIKSHGFDLDFLKPGDLSVLPPEGEENECARLFKESSLNLFCCTECSQMVESLQLHFEGGKTVGPSVERVNDILICEFCGYVSPTKCAASAHKRFHKGEPSFVCPDCGETYLNFSSLLSHMRKDCLHDLKRTIFKCHHCSIAIISIDDFFDHLVAEHVRRAYRCHMCGISSVSFEDFNSHRATMHSLPKLEIVSGSSFTVTECDMCPLISYATEEEHASCHTTHRSNMVTVFQCGQCKNRFPSKTLLIDHIASCTSAKDSDCENKIIRGDLTELFELSDISQGAGTQPQSKLVPSECVPTSENIVIESVQQRERSRLTPANDSTREEKFGDGQDMELKKEISELPSNAQPLEKSVVCKICKKVVCVKPDKVLIKRHFSSEHFDIYMNAIHREVNGQVTQLSEDYVMRTDQEIVNSFLKSFIDKNNIPKIKSKKHNVKKYNSKISKVNDTGFLKAQKSKPVKNVKKCYKCSFTSKDIRAFRSHIILHRSNSSELQCPECGLCFIVRPPLEKHLIAGHGIRNVGKYLSDNGFDDHESEVDLSDNEDQIVNVESDSEVLQENQCKVCKKVFESAMLLEKHFRVHGGAFLLANLKAKRSSL